jgi:hypothetical protein
MAQSANIMALINEFREYPFCWSTSQTQRRQGDARNHDRRNWWRAALRPPSATFVADPIKLQRPVICSERFWAKSLPLY